MNNEFLITNARIQDSINWILDRLPSPKGEDARSEFAGIFWQAIIEQDDKEGGLSLAPAFQTVLLKDPVLYLVAEAQLILDHPTRSYANAFAFGDRVHFHDLPRHLSLYENRFSQSISCERRLEEIQLSEMVNRLSAYDFRGPFAKEAS